MSVNHSKEFFKSGHNEVLFCQLFARPLIQLSSTNFKAKILKMVLINTEFQVVSMVNTAPESLTNHLLYPIGLKSPYFKILQTQAHNYKFSKNDFLL